MAENSRVNDLNRQMDDVKVVMKDNIGKVLERGDKIEVLQDRAEGLEQTAQNFQRTTNRVKRREIWRNRKMTIIIAGVIAVFVLFIVLVALGASGVFSDEN